MFKLKSFNNPKLVFILFIYSFGIICCIFFIHESTAQQATKLNVNLHCDEEAYFPPSTLCTYTNLKGKATTPWNYKHSSDSLCTHFIRPPNVLYVTILSSNIEEIPKGLFINYMNATTLNAPKNNIQRIQLYNFENGQKLQIINLPYNNLTHVPNMIFVEVPILVTLDLSYNRINQIEEQSFYGLKKLKSLDLSHNALEAIPSETFKQLTDIEMLLLNDNKLNVISKEQFLNNVNLKDVDLSKNSIKELSGTDFKNLKYLCYLNLERNQLLNFDSSGLTVNKLIMNNNKLENLHITAKVKSIEARNNRIGNVSCDKAIIETTDLVLRNNMINRVGCIADMAKLENLDLSVNKLLPLNGNEFDKMEKLVSIELANTTISTIKPSTFVKQKNLQRINLANNDMETFDLNGLSLNKELTHLNVEGNNLIQLYLSNVKIMYPNLTELSIARNNWECAYLTEVIKEAKLKSINIPVKNPVYNESNVDGIACSNIFEKPVPIVSNVTAPLSPVVKRSLIYDENNGELNINGTQMDKLPKDLFTHFSNTTTFHASNVGLEKIEKSSFVGAKRLETLDLSSNKIKRLSNTVFSEAPSLIYLNLAANTLEDIDDQAFYGIPKLQKLDLSRNRVRRSALSLFDPLPELEDLNMEENSLWSIEEELFSQNPKLKKVSLANNIIEHITGRPFRNIENMEELNLEGNLINDFTTDGLKVKKLNIPDNQIKKMYHTGNVSVINAENNQIETVISPTNFYTTEMNFRNNSLHDMTGISWNKGLKKLDMSQNRILMLIPADFKYLARLENLNLSSNQIPYLGVSQFLSQKNLNTIDLSNNKMKKIDMMVFKPLDKILKLDLSGNQLKELTNLEEIIDKFDSTSEVILSNNPWNCTNLQEIIKELKIKSVKVVLKDPAKDTECPELYKKTTRSKKINLGISDRIVVKDDSMDKVSLSKKQSNTTTVAETNESTIDEDTPNLVIQRQPKRFNKTSTMTETIEEEPDESTYVRSGIIDSRKAQTRKIIRNHTTYVENDPQPRKPTKGRTYRKKIITTTTIETFEEDEPDWERELIGFGSKSKTKKIHKNITNIIGKLKLV